MKEVAEPALRTEIDIKSELSTLILYIRETDP